MKLISTLRSKTSFEETTKVISEDCSLGQAITMIESWCYDNGANYPRTCDLWKSDGNICVQIITKDNKYINIFDITD